MDTLSNRESYNMIVSLFKLTNKQIVMFLGGVTEPHYTLSVRRHIPGSTRADNCRSVCDVRANGVLV